MTVNALIESLASFVEQETRGFFTPVQTKGDAEQLSEPTVYEYGLEDHLTWQKKAPYVIVQPTGDYQSQPNNSGDVATAGIRFVFVTYNRGNEAEGLKSVMALMERVKIAILKTPVIGRYFTLDRGAGIECLPYLEGAEPFFIAEMSTTWRIPAVKMEVAEFV